MKKTQVALAALALVASSAVMADGATVYGTLDVSAGKSTGATTHFDGSGNWAGSIFGIKGSEDLDGGLKATYELELGLNAGNGRMTNGGTVSVSSESSTTGQFGSSVFNRKANVGLSGDFGSIKAGLQLSPYIASIVGNGVATNNESFYVNLLAMSGSAGATFDATISAPTTGGFFIPNSVSYSTPNINGLSATVLTALAYTGTTTSADKDAQKYTAGSVNYAAGDFRVSATYENANTNLLAGFGESKNYGFSGTYAAGPLTLSGAYINNKIVASSVSTNTYTVGAAYEVMPSTSVSLNYAKNNAVDSQTLTVAGVQYSISKSTSLYATAGRGTNGVSPLYSTFGGTTGSTTGYAVGMYKSF